MLPDRVVSLDRSQEIARDELRALVNELIEGVLAVGARFAPDDRSGRDVDRLRRHGHTLAVALHVALLEVSGEAVHVLVIWQNGLRLGVEEIVVPDAEQPQRDRQILLQRRGAEVFIHRVGAGEQFLKVVEADGNGDGQANGGPERVASADPVPELEHVVRVDAEIRDLLGVR